MYRIYLRINREILDNFWQIFLSIRLIRGSNFLVMKQAVIDYSRVLRSFGLFQRRYKNLNFGKIFGLIFSIQPIRGSTYTRLYTVSVRNPRAGLIILLGVYLPSSVKFMELGA